MAEAYPNAGTGANSSWDSPLARYVPGLQALLRIGAGLLFMQHGAQKLFGVLGGSQVELVSLMGLAGILEFFVAFLFVIGLFTRPVAIILAIEMIIAYFYAHMPQGGFPIENDGELSLLYALIYIFFAAAGAGPASVDRARKRSTAAESPRT